MKILKIFVAVILFGTLSMLDASNNPTVTFSPLSTSVSEGSGDITVTFTLSIDIASDQKDIEIDYTTTNGTAVSPTNFTATSGTITFTKNVAPVNKTFSVVVKTGAAIASNVSFTVNLTNDTNPAQNITLPNTTATITILNIAPPAAVNDSAILELNTSAIIDVLANDTAGNNAIDPSTVAATAPSHGNIDINSTTGAITYTPTAGYVGLDSFTYTVNDTVGSVSNSATVNLNVTYPIPIAYDKVYSVVPSGTLNGNVITDTPVCYNLDDNLAMNANSVPAVGTLTTNPIPSNGSFSYTATAATGSTSFTYSIVNKYGMVSNTATVNIYINEYCANAIRLLTTDTNCTTNDTNSTSEDVTADGGQYYEIVLAEDGVLDINLTNTDPQAGGTILYYDFGQPCGTIFGKGTTSQLDAGYRSETASMVLSAGTYYLGLQGKSNTNPTDYSVEVTFRSACPGGPPIYPGMLSSVGINEVGVDYDVDQNITTKIVNKEFALHASYLDAAGNVATYDGSYDGGKTVDMTVIVAHADGDTCTSPTVIGQGIIYDGDEDTTITPLIIDNAYKNRRTKVTAFDFGQLFTDASGLNCGSSSLNSSLCLVPACFNNVGNIRSVFPPAFQPGVMTCIYGDGSGLAAPCDSNAYYGNCGGRKLTISPAKYNNDLGCAMCLADAMGGDQCSADAFAIRPNDFNTTIVPDQIFLAGKATPLTFTAEDYTAAASPNYNENENTSFTVAIDINDTTKTCAQPSINFSPIVDFTNGTVTDNYTLNNVGDFNLTMHETLGAEFALVDADDTNETLRLIEPFATQIKVIPHHFGIDGNLTNGSNGFTYLSNFEVFDTNASRNISASLDLNVTAQAENNATTSNYTALCYAKDGNLTLTLANAITVTPPASDGSNPLSKLIWYHYTPDSNGSIPITGATEYTLPYLKDRFDSNDTNGTAEFNYKINFDRNVTKVVNPFMIVVNDLNVTDTDGASGAKAGGNATFQFGRTHASRQRYYDTTAPYQGLANIYFESYCFTGCNKTLLPNGVNSIRTDDARWFVIPNPFHTTPTDGSVGTVSEKAATVRVTATAPTATNPSQTTLTYTGTSFPYKTTMQNNASPWLIQNETNPNATTNEFQVEFDLSGGWTGEHETNTTTKTPAGTTTNRRIMW